MYPEVHDGMEDIQKARPHKYIKREGGPGSYKYWYKMPDGTVSAPDELQEQGKAEHIRRLIALKAKTEESGEYRYKYSDIARTVGVPVKKVHEHATNMHSMGKRKGLEGERHKVIAGGHDFDEKHLTESTRRPDTDEYKDLVKEIERIHDELASRAPTPRPRRPRAPRAESTTPEGAPASSPEAAGETGGATSQAEATPEATPEKKEEDGELQKIQRRLKELGLHFHPEKGYSTTPHEEGKKEPTPEEAERSMEEDAQTRATSYRAPARTEDEEHEQRVRGEQQAEREKALREQETRNRESDERVRRQEERRRAATEKAVNKHISEILQSQLMGHQIDILKIPALHKRAKEIFDAQSYTGDVAIETSARRAFREFKDMDIITVSDVPLRITPPSLSLAPTAPAASVENYKTKTLGELASKIRREWRDVNYAAKPYLEALSGIDESGMYGQDTWNSIVAYFLSNASGFRGEAAKVIKKELKRRLSSGKWKPEGESVSRSFALMIDKNEKPFRKSYFTEAEIKKSLLEKIKGFRNAK
jgi:hypothetical protein